MLNRRRFFAGSAALGIAATHSPARAKNLPGIETAALRGAIDAGELGLRPDIFDDQSKVFAKMLRQASDRNVPVFLPAGIYGVSNLTLPRFVRLSGVPGATRIVYGGDGHLFLGEETEEVDLSGLVFDGANRWLGDQAQGLLDFRNVARLAIDNCQVVGSTKNGIALERVGGRIERSTISGAADAGIYSVEAQKLDIAGNSVTDCANGGILAHRWKVAEDGTSITGNRVERIGAKNGGTGQNGNGINVFRADTVRIANNHVADCAFSAIRANSSSNLQISANTCLRSGETAIYAEFAFAGAVISANIVDGAANGISLVNFDQGGRMGVCAGNLVRNLSTKGPYPADPPGFGVGISVEADTTVTGNVIENAPLYGIKLGWGEFLRNVVATGNIIRKAPVGIAVSVVEGTGSAVVSDNIIDGAEKGAVIGYRWTDAATGDLAAAGAEAFSHLTVERNRVG